MRPKLRSYAILLFSQLTAFLAYGQSPMNAECHMCNCRSNPCPAIEHKQPQATTSGGNRQQAPPVPQQRPSIKKPSPNYNLPQVLTVIPDNYPGKSYLDTTREAFDAKREQNRSEVESENERVDRLLADKNRKQDGSCEKLALYRDTILIRKNDVNKRVIESAKAAIIDLENYNNAVKSEAAKYENLILYSAMRSNDLQIMINAIQSLYSILDVANGLTNSVHAIDEGAKIASEANLIIAEAVSGVIDKTEAAKKIADNVSTTETVMAFGSLVPVIGGFFRVGQNLIDRKKIMKEGIIDMRSFNDQSRLLESQLKRTLQTLERATFSNGVASRIKDEIDKKCGLSGS